MKILLVNDYRQMGGCEVLVHLTADGLRRRGHEVHLFFGDRDGARAPGPIGYIDSLPQRMVLRAKLRAFAPDVVHLHNIYHRLSPGILATLGRWKAAHGGRVVMTAHDFHLVCPNAGFRHFKRGEAENADPDRIDETRYLLRRRWDHRGLAVSALKTAQHVWNYRMRRRREVLDAVICPSRFLASMLDRVGLPTVVVPSPAPEARGAAARDESGPLRVVYAGRLEPEKGVAEFLLAFPRDLSAVITIVGEGSSMGACRAAAAEAGIDHRVTFTGRLPRARTLDHVERAHVLVLPSRWYENQPIVLLEALACGAVPLVSDLGGMREVVEDAGVGYVFDPERPETVRDALGRIEHDRARGRLATNVTGFLAERSEDAYLDRLVEVFEGPRHAILQEPV